mmetsp:Transcript_4395/g.8090  ORF Transcript_4395/g.8090 Transcript_4395/m.8090 type:complete len:87 (+) Transcript_4395:1368-1628(+)
MEIKKKKMVEALKSMEGAHFIVGGRLEQNVDTGTPRFVSGKEELESFPDQRLGNEMFTIMDESEFRIDISSSEIRQKQKEQDRIIS